MATVCGVSLEQLIEFRHDLHAHPELGYEEMRTSGKVQEALVRFGIEHRAGLAGGTGILAYLPATVNVASAKCIALRADMDALPIFEQTGLPYASQNEGKMHACGHDGHTTILLGAAEALSRIAERPNHLLFMFQPAEEGGGGAAKMVADGVLDGRVLGPKADFVFGLHGWDVDPVGYVSSKCGPMMASADRFKIIIHGKGCHAAQPNKGVDPIVIGSAVVSALQTIASRGVAGTEPIIVSVTQFHAGTAFNVIPGEAELAGTLRALSSATRDLGIRRVHEIVEGIAKTLGGSAEVQFSDGGYPATINDDEATERFFRVARKTLGEDKVRTTENPSMGAEDFSFYGEVAKASFFRLGLIPPGENYHEPLHSPKFNFNDDAIATGVQMMVALALDAE